MAYLGFILFVGLLSWTTGFELNNILVAALGGIGVFLFLSHWQHTRAKHQFKHWPQTIGEVLDAKLSQISQPGKAHRANMWTPKVSYRYKVAGNEFESDNYFSQAKGADRFVQKKAKSLLRAHKTGAAIGVYYNPETPQQAFISHPIIQGKPVYALVLTLVCTAILLLPKLV